MSFMPIDGWAVSESTTELHAFAAEIERYSP